MIEDRWYKKLCDKLMVKIYSQHRSNQRDRPICALRYKQEEEKKTIYIQINSLNDHKMISTYTNHAFFVSEVYLLNCSS